MLKQPWHERRDEPDDLPSLLDRLLNLQAAEGIPRPSKDRRVAYAFRGMPCHSWRLEPTLLHRIMPKGDAGRLRSKERSLVENFRRESWRFLGPIERNWLDVTAADLVRPDPVGRSLEWENPKIWSVLAVARHYGTPTRLLDWSDSILVAAYFASCSKPASDGAIWWFNQYDFEKALTWKVWGVPLRKDGSEEVALELKAFGADATPWISKIHHVARFSRMERQSGFFTACGEIDKSHDDAIDALVGGDVGRGRLIIPANLKGALLDMLERMGVAANTIDYPGADAVAHGISANCNNP